MSRWFFTFGGSTPYRQCYVEIVVPEGPESRSTAREVMFEAHGKKWGFEYDEATFLPQIEEYGLKRLSLIEQPAPHRAFAAVEIMGEN